MSSKPKLPVAISLTTDEVKQIIANIHLKQMNVSIEKTLSNTPFIDLHKDFDSLAMMELQLLLEEELHFELDFKLHQPGVSLPTNVSELALEVLRQHAACIATQTAQTKPSKS